jgi:LacI family transcriptional regulator
LVEKHLTRRVTINDVARLAGVSPMTVSRVVNGSNRVTSATRDRVEEAMRSLGYIPNRAARSLVVNKLDVLALVIPDISNPFFPRLARGAEAAAREAGYTVILGNTDEDFEQELAYLRAICALRVDGVLLAPAGARSILSLELLRRLAIPVVLIDREITGVQADVIRGESRQSARALTEHLIRQHAHQSVGLITGPEDVSTAQERERGYLDALTSLGLPIVPSLINRTEYNREAGRRAAINMLAQRRAPSALVTGNNFQAFGVIDAARELGRRVPEELAVVTFDDVEIVAEEPFFTCAAQPAEDMGRVGVERLIGRLKGDESPPSETVLQTVVHIRRSCGCELSRAFLPSA